ncbi:MAG: nucleotidyltransferase family protein [Nanobdellota archaeon]
MDEKISLVYMVAGISRRFGGKIKGLQKVGPEGETLLEFSMKQAIKAGVDDFILIVGNKTEDAFKEYFGNLFLGKSVRYAKQSFDEASRDKPWGTTDALLSAKDLIDNPFVVCNGDDIYGDKTFEILIDHLRNKDNNVTTGFILKNTLTEDGNDNRGVFEVEDGKVKDLKEIYSIYKENISEKGLTGNEYCSMNIFGLQPEVLDMLQEKLNSFKRSHEGDRKAECLLPNDIGELIKEGKISLSIYPTDETWYGVTHPGDEIKLKEKLAK